MPVSVEEMNGPDQVRSDYEAEGITSRFLAKQTKRQFRVKVPKPLKIKGAVDPASLPRGWKVVTTSGIILELEDENGIKRIAGNGETVLLYKVWDAGAALDATKLSHQMRGDVPASNHNVKLERPLLVEIVEFSESDCRRSNTDT